MAAITASMVGELRAKTDAPMMECKRALTEAGGDMDKAEELLRVKLGSKASKASARITAEGIVAVHLAGTTGAMVELNCETDFVAKNDDFLAFGNALARLIAEKAPADVAALSALEIDGQTVEARRTALVGKIGENMSIRRFQRFAGDAKLVSYLHGTRIGVVVAYQGDDVAAKDVAMHVAAMKPVALSVADVPAELIEKERNVATMKAAEDAPQLGSVEDDAVEPLRLLAQALGVGVGEDVHAVHALDDADLAVRVAGQAGVMLYPFGTGADAVAGLESRRAGGTALGRRAPGERRRHIRRAQRATLGDAKRDRIGAFGEQLPERREPDLVVAALGVVGQRLARGAAHVDVPCAERAGGERQRQRARLPRGMEQLALRLGHDPAVAGLAAEVGVGDVAHDCAPRPGSSARPVPIIESRVTSAARSSSDRSSLPGGRCGITR